MLRELLASFGIEFDEEAVTGMFDAVGSLTDQVFEMGEAFVDNAVVQGVMNFTNNVTEAANAIRQVAGQVDESTDKVQEWGFLFAQVGLEMDEVGDVITTLQERARDAKDSKDVEAMFTSIGVNVRDARGELKSANDLFRETVQGMSRMTNSTDQAGLALTLFGDNGRRLLPILREGAAAIDESSEEFRRLGGGLSGEAIMATLEYTQAMAKLKLVMEGIKSVIAEYVIPVVAYLVSNVAEALNSFRKFIDETRILKAAMILLAAAVAVYALVSMPAAISATVAWLMAMAPIIGTVLLVVAIIGLLLLFIEDLIVMFEGGQSVIGDFIDALFGAGSSAKLVEGIKDAWGDFFDFWEENLDDLPGLWEDLTESLSYVWEMFTEWTSGVWEELGESLKYVWDEFTNWFFDKVATFLTPFVEFGSAVKSMWGKTIDGLTMAWSTFVQVVTRGISDVLSRASTLAGGLGLGDLSAGLSVLSGVVGTVGAPSPSGGPGSVTGTTSSGGVVTNQQVVNNNNINVTGPDPETLVNAVRTEVDGSNERTVRELRDQASRRVPA